MAVIINGTSGITDVDGSAAAPAITGTDTDTGLFFSANTLGMATGGTQRAVIDSSGNLGLGVTPSASATYKTMQIGPNIAALYLASAGNDAIVGDSVYYNAGWKYAYSGIAVSYYQQASGSHKWFSYGSGTSGTGVSGGAGQAMTLDSSGNLGLGVTPSAWVNAKAYQVGIYTAYAQRTAGTSDLSMSWNATITSGTNSGTGYVYRYTGDVASAYEQNGAHRWYTAPSGTAGNAISFTQAMTLDASGNLGVGATSPTFVSGYKTVEAQGSSGGIFQTSGSGSSVVSRLYSTTTDGFVGTNSNHAFGFITNGTERARIDSSGSLLVGTTNSDPTFNRVNGSVLVHNGSILCRNSGGSDFGTSGSSGTHIYFYTDNGSARVTAGNIASSGSTTTYNTSSDYRLKNITGPVTNSGAYIDSLNPVEGTWKADGSPFVGLIAHEVQEVSRTQVATGEKDGEKMQSMDYSSAEIIANLIAEVKSLRARIAALENK